MSWYGIDAVDRALSRTRKALFEPFDFWKWVKLAIIIFLLGGIGSNYGSSGTNYRMNPEDLGNLPNIEPGKTPEFPFNLNLFQFKEIYLDSEISGMSGFIQNLMQSDAGFIPDYFSNGISASAEKLYFTDTSFAQYGLIIAAIAVLVLLILFFSYISSVMEFVFVESLVRNEVKFWAYSRRFLGKGFYLLLVRLALGLVFLTLFGIAALPLVPAILENPSDFAWPALVGGIFWIAGVIIVLILLGAAINSFLSLAIPLSIYRNEGILSAFGLVFANFRKNWQEVLVYWLIRFVLGIGVAILAIFLFGLIVLVLGLAFLILDGILYFLFSFMVSEFLIWVLLIPFIIIELILILGALLLFNVPLAVFLKYHLLSFLEAWFADAEIPFFDAPALEPEIGFNEPEPDF
jgi:hypothetical protein